MVPRVEPAAAPEKGDAMSTQPFARFEEHGPLTQVREGMTVYDRADERVGTVRQVYFGNTTETGADPGLAPVTGGATGQRDDSLFDTLAEAFGGGETLPETFRERLAREGYLQIDSAGLFAGDRFATPDQIAEVREDRVTLNVDREELVGR